MRNKFAPWFSASVTTSSSKQYVHLLLTEDCNGRGQILIELKRYVQQAHEDARRRLQMIFGESLDPLNPKANDDIINGYPQQLHMQTLKGYFGEIFSGLVAEHFSPLEEEWEIPAYLFRFHLCEFQQLEALRQTEEDAKLRPGRTGDDCLAFLRDNNGNIMKYLYCEAKCTSSHKSTLIDEAHEKVSQSVASDIPQLIEILMDYTDNESVQWVQALRQLRLRLPKKDDNLERCDLVSYICGQSPKQGERKTWISTNKPHQKYMATRRLQAVEAHIQNVEDLIQEVYKK